MKTETQLQKALSAKCAELENIKERIDRIQTWISAASFMEQPDLFISQVKEREATEKREAMLNMQIEFLQWILD